MLVKKPASRRAPVEPGAGRLVLDTEFHDKKFRTWITAKPGLQPDDAELAGAEQVRVAVLANHHQTTMTLSHMLKTAQSGDALVIVCNTPKAYQAALSYLGYAADRP
ncbi:hypothetical protein [Azomonas macrocytogenes]|uniref:Uncharacterized protein n=1 Tax=Azomonas macrocytogenes TaxID=69962 RepID=A0A839SZ36_AZOMA|nr:hypothetical protein [Azomonas macrocytogenes]MBB3102601.1 hypothetical protein [Azomonas macrocytogenes]